MRITIAVAVMIVTVMTGQMPVVKAQDGQVTISWVEYAKNNAGCQPLASVNGNDVPSGYLFCPNQSASWGNYDGGASLYVPDGDTYSGTFEGFIVTRDPIVVTSLDSQSRVATYSQTMHLTMQGWAGQRIGSFSRTYRQTCTVRHCTTTSVNTPTGGSGSITASSDVAPVSQ
jgi:hypothetical protein